MPRDPTFATAQAAIAYAYENVGFFRGHMDQAALRPGDIATPADMLRLPPTRKTDYRRGFPANVIARGYSMSSRHVLRFQSSGTEGERLVSVVMAYDLARRQATCLDFNPGFKRLWEPGLQLRTCRYAAPNCSDVECSSPNASMESRTLADRTLVLPVYHDLLTTPRDMAVRALDEIEAHDPHLLFVDPTHFAFLVRAMRREGRRPHRTRGVCINSGYTLCTQVARRQIRECYGDTPFADMLGMSEIGYLGFECPLGRVHLNATDYYVEFLRDGKPSAPEDLSELVLTTLDDRLSPHIRYATGDLFTRDPASCPCGCPSPVVFAEGRAKNALVTREGGVVTPRMLDQRIGAAPYVDLYRMNQTAEDDFDFQYVPSEHWTVADERDLVSRLRDLLQTHNLRVAAREYLPSDRGGKFISCVSAVGGASARVWS